MLFEKAFLVKEVKSGDFAIVTAVSKSKAIMQGVEAFQCEKSDVEILDFNKLGGMGKDFIQVLKLNAHMKVLGDLSKEIGNVFLNQQNILVRMINGNEPSWALKLEVKSLEEKLQQLREAPILNKKLRIDRNDIVKGFAVTNDRLLNLDFEEATYYLALTQRLFGSFFSKVTPELDEFSEKLSGLISKLGAAQIELLEQLEVHA